MAKDKGGHGSGKRSSGFDRLAAEMRKAEPKRAPQARNPAFDRMAAEIDAEMRAEKRKKKKH